MKTRSERIAELHEDVALRMLETKLNSVVWIAVAEAVDDVARAFPTVSRATLASEAIEALTDASTAHSRRAKLMAPHPRTVKLRG